MDSLEQPLFTPNYLGRTEAFENGLPIKFVKQKQEGARTTALGPEKETNAFPEQMFQINECLPDWVALQAPCW